MSFEYQPLSDEQEAKRLGDIMTQCFIGSPDDRTTYFGRIGVNNLRAIHVNGRLAGGLALIEMGQWWNQRAVPMTGIASVAIAPEQRGSGAAIELMRQMLRELYDQGIPLSALYPATQRLYRKAGYEQSGSWNRWSIAASTIELRDRPLPIEPIANLSPNALKPFYQQQAQCNSGCLDRADAIWGEIFSVQDPSLLYAYWMGAADRPEGYVLFTQERHPTETSLQIRDWALLTPAAIRSFWAFLAGHRSQIDRIGWKGGWADPLVLSLPEQTARLRASERWFLRLVNVPVALEKRGYPVGAAAELHLSVQDDLIAENQGRFVLSVQGDRAQIQPGGRGDMQLNMRGLATLYSGLYTAQQLQTAGMLEATEPAIAAATQLFTGMSPWMPDFF